jgi:hypothetical protein
VTLTLVLLGAFVALYACAWGKGFTAGQRWERGLERWRYEQMPNPNPFGDLPPMQPMGEEPTQYLDVDIVTRRLEPIGIATIAIHYNQREARN